MVKKKRPREHIIADLSINYVERYIFLCGYSVERIQHDYGYDLVMFTYDINGEIENGQVYIQLKATDYLKTLTDEKTIAFKLARADLELWLFEPMPCILVIYDSQSSQAYWLYLQAYFENIKEFNIAQLGESVTVYLPKTNIIDVKAIKQFKQYRDGILSQLKGVIRHYD